MAEITLPKKCLTGIGRIDDQHRQLFDYVDKLHDLLHYGGDNDAIHEVLEGAREYTDYHFLEEEELFRKHNYPGTEKHLAIHKKFRNQLDDFEKKFDSEDAILADFLTFLEGWLTAHIQGADMEFIEWLKEQNISAAYLA